MAKKLKVLFFVFVAGLLLSMAPEARLYSADDVPAGPSTSDHITSASVQFILVQIERETLDELTDESNVLTLESVSLEKIGRCIHEEDGAEIVSQTKITIINGHEAEMSVVENERRKEKNAGEGNSEEGQRETEVNVWIEAGIHDGDRLAARFTYRRSVVEEGRYSGRDAEEEEGGEHKFAVSTGILLHAGQARIVGANLNEGIATLLIMKADLL